MEKKLQVLHNGMFFFFIQGDNYFVILMITLGVLMIVCTMWFLFGLKNDNPVVVLPWLIVAFMWIFFVVFSFLYFGVQIILFGVMEVMDLKQILAILVMSCGLCLITLFHNFISPIFSFI